MPRSSKTSDREISDRKTNVRVRQANFADIPAIMGLERQYPPAAHWSRRQYEAIFASPSGPADERLAWLAEMERQLPGKTSSSTGILGFLVAHRVDTDWELENIVVAEAARRRSVGTRLMAALISRARTDRGSGISLEVRESNQSARALYRKLSFEETGLRRGYYVNPQEDAILCRLRLS